MSLSPTDVQRIARLARLSIDEQQAGHTLERLNEVFGLIERLQAVDTAGVEPLAHVQDLGLRLRDDRVTETDQRDRMQAAAPAVERGLYLVPKVIE
ncbi:MAG: Asp-tRNA(Asn)/Glu-tRNA(Gln) amidotransferase subunit GatC [Burkholderiaceae bacterium]|nr:Asp-tRNA(Asn)/Glu-tRNA(Gln) amidotransferase subunit GatC [Burkholderiaceae bacterium]